MRTHKRIYHIHNKKFLPFVIIGMVCLLITGCGDDDDTPFSTTPPPAPATPPPAAQPVDTPAPAVDMSAPSEPTAGTVTQATDETPAEFVAGLSDFAGYAFWRTIDYSTGPTNPFLANSHMALDDAFSRRVWINESGARSRDAGDDTYPLGTVIVKETFTWDANGDKQYAEMGGVLAMVKRGGNFNREGNHWEWFMLASDPKTSTLQDIMDRGGPELMNGMCNRCHTSAQAQVGGGDMVFAHPSDLEVTDGFFADYASWPVVQNTPENHVLLSAAHASGNADTLRRVYKKQLQANPLHPPDAHNVITDVYPIGTAIVKTVEDTSGIIEMTAMVKRNPSFNPDHNGWEWFMLSPPTGAVASARRGAALGGNMCNVCHAAARVGLNGVDYVFKHPNDPFVNFGEPELVTPAPAPAPAPTPTPEPATPEPMTEPVVGTTAPGEFMADYATNPAFFTNMATRTSTVGSVHGRVQIWYSTNIKDMLESGSSGPWPEGTVSIKEAYKAEPVDDDVVDEIAVMVKREPGYDAANGDWYYEMRNPRGELLADPAPGNNTMCISCHVGWSSTDYLAGLDLR